MTYFQDAAATYQRDLLARVRDFRKTGMCSDVTLVCDEEEFQCHKLILVAASDYFAAMFEGHFAERTTKKVPIRGIDSCTLAEILQFVYEGDASFVNDDNVLEVLAASDLFLLSPLRRHCIRYLTERRVPMSNAFGIFSFASATQDTSLLSAARECILDHVEQLSSNSEFTMMPYVELVDVIAHFHSSSTRHESQLLSAIAQWVFANRTAPEVESTFIELVRTTPFVHLKKDCTRNILKHYYANILSPKCDEVVLSGDGAAPARTDVKELPLHVLANCEVEGALASQLLTPRRNGEREEWYPCGVRKPVVADDMRNCFLNDHVYTARSKGRSKLISFEARPLTDLSAGKPLAPSLAAHEYNLPRAKKGKSAFSLCSDGQNEIYMCHGSCRNSAKLDVYYCSTDSWFPLSIHATELEASIMTWHDGRLVLLDHKDEHDRRGVRAYDPRIGTLTTLSDYSSLTGDFQAEECCVHKGRIYVSSGCATTDGIRARIHSYDPVVDRWETIANQPQVVGNHLRSSRILSCNDELRLLRFSNRRSAANLQAFDSYVGEWTDRSPALQAALQSPDARKSHVVDVLQFD